MPKSSIPQADLIRLRHMLDAAREARAFAKGETRQSLNQDRKLVLSLVKDIEIIGEAASKVSPGTRAIVTDVPWRETITMRHHLIHMCYEVDLDVLWDTVTDDLPPLVKALERLVASSDQH